MFKKYCIVLYCIVLYYIILYYIIFITFPLQQWLHERVLTLRYTYRALPVLLNADLAVHKTGL